MECATEISDLGRKSESKKKIKKTGGNRNRVKNSMMSCGHASC
jgi:hypothetical protein